MVFTMRLFFAQYRWSPALVVAPVTLVVGMWGVLYSHEPLWLGRWLDTELYVESYSALIAGPVAAGTAAVAAANCRREGLATIITSTARGRFGALCMVWLTAVAWCCGIVLLVMIAAWGRTWTWSDFGLGVPWVLFVTFAVVTLEVSLGVVAGAVLPRFAAAAAVVGGLYGFYYLHVQGDLSSPWRRYFPVIQEHWDPQFLPVPGRLLTAAIFCVSLGVLFVALATRVSGDFVPLSIVAVAVSFAVVSGLYIATWDAASGASLYSRVRSQDDVLCREVMDGRVCVWAGDRAQLDSLAAGYALAARGGRGLNVIPNDVVQTGISTGRPTLQMLTAFAPEPPAFIGAAIVEMSVTDPMDGCRFMTSPLIDGRPWRHVFTAVLLDRAGIGRESLGGKAESVVAQIDDLPRDRQLEWLDTGMQTYARCETVPPLS